MEFPGQDLAMDTVDVVYSALQNREHLPNALVETITAKTISVNHF